MWFENLVAIKKASGKTLNQISSDSGVPIGTLNKLFAGQTKDPKLDTVRSVVHALGYTLDDLDDSPKSAKSAPRYSSEAMNLARDYDGLDSHGKKAVRAVTDVEKARCAEQAQAAPAREPDETIHYITDWFPTMPMSAGTGQPADHDKAEELELTKRPPRGTSFVAPVSGDSMEPTYHDGDKLFIRRCEEIEPGQIGVFYMDGKLWVKELGDGELISHNPAYPPRPMTEDVRCQGLVLGVCDEGYFE